jgi:hypothetical protein
VRVGVENGDDVVRVREHRPELCFGVEPIRDLAYGDDNSPDEGVFEHAVAGQLDPAPRAVTMADADHLTWQWSRTSGDRSLQRPEGVSKIIGMHEVESASPDLLLGIEPEKPLG